MKLFLSSPNNDKLLHLFQKYKCQYYLWSYLYLKKMTNVIDYMKCGGEVFVDSGAHTLQKPGKSVDWDKFVWEYIGFINKYKDYINYIVELDIEDKVGLPQVEKWNDLIIRETGRKPISVWHRNRSIDYYKYMCKKYEYVGFSGFVVDPTGGAEVPKEYINTFIKIAHDLGARIHGFGYTQGDLHLRLFDSVDSSSWTAVNRFGDLKLFTGHKMQNVKKLRNFANHHDEVREISIREWVKYQKYMDTRPPIW